MRTRSIFASALLVLTLAACDGDPPGADAGMGDGSVPGPDGSVDSGRGDGSTPGGLCDAPRAVTLTMGEQTLTGDTTSAATGFPLADGCGMMGGSAPTEVFAMTIPGTGLKGVTLDLLNDATTWDTILEVRPDGCEATSNTSCFDDFFALFGIVQSVGSFTAMGGDTIYVVLTGFPGSEDGDRGAYEMKVEVQDATAPSLTGGTAYRVGTTRYDLLLDGMDAEGDASFVRLSFLDGSGTAIGVDTDEDASTPDETVFEYGFERISGRPTYRALVRIDDATFVAATAAAAQVQVTVLDDFELESASMTFAITDVTEASLGGVCGASIICADGFECAASVCAIPAAVVAACGAATPVSVTPGATLATTTVTGSLGAGDSHFFGSCGDTGGAEAIYTVTVSSAGTHDLLASTDLAGSGDADTVVYIRSTCGDPTTEVACNDDAGDGYLSTAVLEAAAAGTYTIAVEMYGGADMSTPFELGVSLRPVLGAGSPCDPTEEMNRCSTAACPTMGDPICPPAT